MKAYRTCPLCEATCGLELTIDAGQVSAIRGDDQDVFSAGFLCPKGFGLKGLHEDPDRLRQPLVRRAGGDFQPVGWDEAFAEIDRGLAPIIAEHGRDAVAAYLGNPNAHNLSVLYSRVLLKALGSRNIFSASTVDQYPKQMAAAYMFGGGSTVPVPDVDRTDYLLILGANPLASNGSLMTAPNMRGRLRAIQERGGRVVVIDPRRSRTAEVADEHHFIRPGTDALALFALVHTLFDEQLEDLGALAEHCEGLETVRELAADFAPETVAGACAIPAPQLRRLARELARAPRAAVYGRIGTCTQEFGTLASWLVDVLNALTGNLDREGGAMFPRAAAGASNTRGAAGRGRGSAFGRWSSRVRGLNEIFGELPVACLAEEIQTPGEGQVRALITMAGNPVLSTPNSGRLDQALSELDFMVCVDIYLNETTRHANVILPAPSPLEHSHYDVALYQFAVRNVANYSPPTLPAPAGMLQEWESLLRLTGVVSGQGPSVDIDALDELVAGETLRREVATEGSAVADRQPADLLAETVDAQGGARRGPERLLDIMLRCGPYGDAYGARPEGLSLATLEATPHGIDLGPLQRRVPEVLRTASGRIELAPAPVVADVARLREASRRRADGMLLIGRRQLRSNNSWMHNVAVLVKGPVRCTMHVHPEDAGRLGLSDGASARVSSRTGEIEVPVEVTDAIMPGVVSIPHGWGHDPDSATMRVAAAHSGVNSNLLADELAVDVLSGNAVLNGIPVRVQAAGANGANGAAHGASTPVGAASRG
ncbi:MAG TPA: molybdopterin-dependent oxidoreductase [Solirubrobacteraceae bacterium]|jgi:anaerobic selenocysteine-containing dehydrogenase|nr:molybdopterin-dependent oxidoreductase [Solirubrobacteraceae bacterium]